MNNIVYKTFCAEKTANNWVAENYPNAHPFPDRLIKVSEQPSCIGGGWSIIVYHGEIAMNIRGTKSENDANRIAKELQAEIGDAQIVKSYVGEKI